MKIKTIIMALFVILVAISTLALSSCQPAPVSTETAKEEAVSESEPAEEEAKPVKLVMWWWGEQEAKGMEGWLNESINLYQKDNPNVTIEAVLQPTEQLIPAFITAAQSRSGPDIQFLFASIFAMEHVFAGRVAPLSDYWSEEEIANLQFPKEITYNDKVWISRYYSSINPMIYNKDIFQKVGLDAEKPPATWDEFLDACEKLKSAGYIPLAIGDKESNTSHFQWFAGYFGAQNLDSVYEFLRAIIGEEKLTDPKYAEWFTKIYELYKLGYINSDASSLDMYQANEYFAKGEAAMTAAASGNCKLFDQALGGNKIAIMKVPVFGTGKLAGKQSVFRKNLAITEWSPNKETAADFLRFIATPDRLKAMYDACGVFPGNLQFKPEWITDPFDRAAYESLLESSDGVQSGFIPPYIDAEGYWVAGQKLFAGELTPEQAAQWVEDTAEKWRKDQPEIVEALTVWTEGMK